MEICDFANSYMTWVVQPDPNSRRKPGHMPYQNRARIQLDARCEVANDRVGESDEFFLITPCRAEWMYRSDTLFQQPSREYCCIWSQTDFVSTGPGCGAVGAGDVPVASLISDSFLDFKLTIRHFPGAQELSSAEQIVTATQKNLPLVGLTAIESEDGQVRATLEYPIKTMNINADRGLFQVDTGPMIVPDLSSASERMIEWFDVAFVCYNAFDIAEFLLRKPAPVLDDVEEGGKVVKYSEVRRIRAQNSVYCAGRI